MGDSREFWLAVFFILLGMAASWGIGQVTPARDWLGVFQARIVLVGGVVLGQLFVFAFGIAWKAVARRTRKP